VTAGGSRRSAPAGVTVSPAALREHCATVLAAAGLDDDAAGLVADSLVDAEMRGIGSHGVTRLRIYTTRLRRGLVDPRARPAVVTRLPGPTVGPIPSTGLISLQPDVYLVAVIATLVLVWWWLTTRAGAGGRGRVA